MGRRGESRQRAAGLAGRGLRRLLLAGTATALIATQATPSPTVSRTSRSRASSGSSRRPILSYADIARGESLTAGELNDAYQRLVNSGLFETVELVPQGNTLVIRVEERPTINRITIEGNRRLDDEELSTVVQSQPRRVYSPNAGRGGRRAHRRRLPPERAPGGHGRAADHPPRREPRRPGLRGHRGRHRRDRADLVRRQPRLFRPPAAARAGDQAGGPAASADPARHVRRRAHRVRPAVAARLLPFARLRRLPDPGRQHRARARAGRHLHHLQRAGGAVVRLRPDHGRHRRAGRGRRASSSPCRGSGRAPTYTPDRGREHHHPDGAAGDAQGPELRPGRAAGQPQRPRPDARHRLPASPAGRASSSSGSTSRATRPRSTG